MTVTTMLAAAEADTSLTDVLAQLAGGGRLALMLFAVMSLLAWLPIRGAISVLEQYRRRSWLMLSVAVLAFSPAHAAWLLGYPIVDPAWNHLMDIVASLAGCGCLIFGLAARGLMRGLSEKRVHRGVIANVLVLFAIVGASWLTR